MNEWMNEYDLWEAYKKYQMCQIYYMLYVTLIGDTIWPIYATYRGHMPFISTKCNDEDKLHNRVDKRLCPVEDIETVQKTSKND